MNDRDLQAKYPLPPDMAELADTLAHGHPRPRPAAEGIADMQNILKALHEEKALTLASIEQFPHQDFQPELAALNDAIADHEARLREYQTQAEGIN
jgi:hypothetical protein